LGLTLTGTLGVLLKAKEQKLITEIKPLIAQLRQAGIWLSDSVVEEALKLAGEY
jgi:predicted nucleic acid-binding protein